MLLDSCQNICWSLPVQPYWVKKKGHFLFPEFSLYYWENRMHVMKSSRVRIHWFVSVKQENDHIRLLTDL